MVNLAIAAGVVSSNFYPSIVGYITGATASTTPIQLTVWTNYEAIPIADNADFVFAETSVSDVNTFQRALNILGNIGTFQSIALNAAPVLTGVVAAGLANARRRIDNRMEFGRAELEIL